MNIRRIGPVLLAIIVTTAGCGSNLDRGTIAEANGFNMTRTVQTEETIPGATGSAEAGVPQAESTPADPGAASAPPGGPAASASAGGTAATAPGGTAGSGGSPAKSNRPSGSGSATARPGATAPTATGGARSPGAGAATGAATAAAAKKEIVFGAFGTTSGPIGAAVAPIPPAIRAWTASVNAAGGLNGHPVRWITADDNSDPGKARAIAQRMVEQDGVVAFLGLYSPLAMQGALPYLESKRVPVISGGGSNSAEDQSPMVFNAAASLYGAYRGVLHSMSRQSPVREIAVIYCREAQACTGNRDAIVEYAPKVKFQVVYEAQVSVAQPDFTAEVLAARNAGAKGVIVVADGSTIVRVIKSIKRQGWSPVIASPFSAYDPAVGAALGGDANGLISYATTAPFSLSATMKPYRDALARYEPGAQPANAGANAWVGGKLLETIAPALGDTVRSEDILKALLAVKGNTLGGLVGPVTFTDGPHPYANSCVVPLLYRSSWTAPFGDTFDCVPPR